MSGFKTKARAVELLGRKQIRDSVTALAELMKNAYDADASWLRVEFNTKAETPYVVISDKGEGMSQNDIETKWLVLGTNSKTSKKNKVSTKGRPLMGAKGIGRLASATVGKQLWLFTKTAVGLWNILFIHWDIFENPYISIEDIHIPARYSISPNELILNISNIIPQMLEEQLSNLEHDGWHVEDNDENLSLQKLYMSIKNDLEQPSINYNVIENYIRSLKKGTILYIDKLYDKWGNYLAPVSTEQRKSDAYANKMYNRFATFAAPFSNLSTDSDTFDVEIYLDGKLWEEDNDLTEEDYNLFDIKVEGEIKHGVFKGGICANNVDEAILNQCNEALKMGLDVTSGISNWDEMDCGAFTIKFCHIEGEKNYSNLTADDYDRIKRKLETTRGICIYRDNVRVLPYGEPENDFLAIEQRRTLKASTYIFSHRNIFGRIDINSKENPMLEDKSSREGLIENQYYFYFIKTLENLLIDLAMNFLSSVRNNSLGLRDSYVDRNKQVAANKRKKNEFEKKEKKEARKEIEQAEKKLKEIPKYIEQFDNKINIACLDYRNSEHCLSALSGYSRLQDFLHDISIYHEKTGAEIKRLCDECHININIRYEHYYSEKLKERIFRNNDKLCRMRQTWLDTLDELLMLIKDSIQNKTNEWQSQIYVLAENEPEKIKNSLLSRLSSILNNSRDSLAEIDRNSRENTQSLLEELNEVCDFIDELKLAAKSQSSFEIGPINKLLDDTAKVGNRIENLFNNSPKNVVEQSTEIVKLLEDFNTALAESLYDIKIKESTKLGEITKKTVLLTSVLSDVEQEQEKELLIGSLRQDNIKLQAELDIYSDLANMGLAAEIVNHEFNQLFTNVNSAIKSMTPYIKDPTAKYWLRQIDMGFRSISDRQNQLSPMYRSYSLRKADVNLYGFIEEIKRFMSATLEHSDINLKNQINSDVDLYISKSKIFPAITNLINNAAYWVLNSKEKLIIVRYDIDEQTLFIEDSGPGIKAIDKNSIFDPFVSFKPHGRGLGLTIARKVIESQGFQLNIAKESEKTLSGACFKIIFTKETKEID